MNVLFFFLFAYKAVRRQVQCSWQGSSDHGLALLDFTVITIFNFLQKCSSIERAKGEATFFCPTLQMYLFLWGSSSYCTRFQIYGEWRLSNSCSGKYMNKCIKICRSKKGRNIYNEITTGRTLLVYPDLLYALARFPLTQNLPLRQEVLLPENNFPDTKNKKK